MLPSFTQLLGRSLLSLHGFFFGRCPAVQVGMQGPIEHLGHQVGHVNFGEDVTRVAVTLVTRWVIMLFFVLLAAVTIMPHSQ